MKREKIIAICIMVVILTFNSGCIMEKNQNQAKENIEVFHFSENNGIRQLTCQNEQQIFYYSDDKIYEYCAEGEKILLSGVKSVSSIAATENNFYYVADTVKNAGTLYCCDLKTSQIRSMEDNVVDIAVYNGDIWFSKMLDDDSNKIEVYRSSEADMESKENITEYLASNGKRLNEDEDYVLTCEMDEYEIWGSYCPDYGMVKVECVVAKDCGNIVADFDRQVNKSSNYAFANGEVIRFYENNYQQKGMEAQKKVENLISETESAYFYTKHMIEEGNKVVGLLQYSDYTYTLMNPVYKLTNDRIVAFYPEDGQIEIIYETDSHKTRIIGYYDEKVYLYQNGKIEVYDTKTEETKELVEIEKGEESTSVLKFDWCNGYIFVFSETKLLQVVSIQ